MAVVLQDLYGLVSYKQMALVAGKKGMNRPVRWLHMVESVDIASFWKVMKLPCHRNRA